MATPYKEAEIPEFTPLNQRGLYDDWTKMMQETEGDRAKLGSQKMDTLKSLLDKIPGYTELETGMTNMFTQMMAGDTTDTHKKVLRQQADALRQDMGMQGSGAGLNMTLASFGRAGLQAQQSAMAMVPQFMTNLRSSFMGNIANDPSVMGPSWSDWSSQAQADHRDVFDSRVAQAESAYQAGMLNTQYNIQKQERAAAQSRLDAANKAAQDRADRIANMQIHNQVAWSNNAAMGASTGMVNPFRYRS
jgi:hypothetical protein